MVEEKILIVDDNASNIEFLRDSLLGPSGYTTLCAMDGEEALHLALTQKPDLILLDLQMPKMDGLEVLEALHRAGHETPAILITAHGSENVAVQAFRLGVRDYFPKPFKATEMIEAVERSLTEVRLKKEKQQLAERIELVNRQLEQRLRELNILYGISKSVTSLLDLDTLLNRVTEATAYVTGAEEVSLFLFDEATQDLQLSAIQGVGGERARGVRESADDAVVRQVMNTGQAAMIQSSRSRKTEPLQVMLAVPLEAGEKTIGVLRAASEMAMEPFTDNDQHLLSMLAGYAAIAIENVRLYEAAQQELAERKRAEETIRQLAYYDHLTGLPNRVLFYDRLKLALAHAARNKQMLAVMLLDLDHLKEVNDELGHAAGDQLLQAVGDRLTALLRKGDTVARMGGDEFLLILPEITGAQDTHKVAQKVMDAIKEPLVLDDRQLHISTSIGIAVYPDDGEDADTLVKNADIAMYRAKEKGRDNYQRYTPS
jgi:diguanylate cyclase (GGDEF)-like protein